MSGPVWPGETEMAASPSPEDQRPEPAVLGPPPWEDQDRPRLPGYYQTLAEVLRRPAFFFRRPAQGGPLEPFAFGLITGTTGALLALFWWLLLLLARSRALETGLPHYDLLVGTSGTVLLVGGMVLTPLMVISKLVLSSLCLWAAVALLGVRSGFAPCWRLSGYATAAATLAVIPFLGSFLIGLMLLFILHQGLRGALGMSAGRALGALAIFVLLQILIAALLMGGFLALLTLLGLLLLS